MVTFPATLAARPAFPGPPPSGADVVVIGGGAADDRIAFRPRAGGGYAIAVGGARFRLSRFSDGTPLRLGRAL